MLQLGSRGEDQLDLMPGNVTRIPPVSTITHSGSLIGKKKFGSRNKRPLNRPRRTLDTRPRFYLDFGFMQALSLDYQRPNKATDRVIASWDVYSWCLLVVDEASRYIFLPHKIQGAAS
jgi:hypothetical protein